MGNVKSEKSEFVSREYFNYWRRGVAGAFVILAVAFGAGLYFFGVKSHDDLISSFNSQRSISCATGQKNTIKFNDFVNDAIKARTNEAISDEKQGNKVQAKLNWAAAVRYQNDLEHVRTDAECRALLLK